MPDDAITPFTLAVPQADLEDLNRRIGQCRCLPDPFDLRGVKERCQWLDARALKRVRPQKTPLNPGGTETEGAHAAGVMGTESKKQLIASTPLGGVGQPEDIARVAVFLASDDAGWLTGEIIFANSGNR
jgi:hypothetical protein